MAMGSASEVECHLLLACDLGYLDKNVHQVFEEQVRRVKRMLTSLLKTLKRS
jgi:four helix bundle protein